MQGTLRKMTVDLQQPVKYQLPLGEQLIELNPYIGRHVKLTYTGKIYCIHCQRAIKKSFNQGFCYPCFASLAQCDMCIMKPEL